MIDLILNNITGLLQVFSKTLLPLFLLLYGWYRWGKYWRKKIERPFNDIVFESGLKNKGTLRHRLLSIFLPLIGIIIVFIGYAIILYCVSYLTYGESTYRFYSD